MIRYLFILFLCIIFWVANAQDQSLDESIRIEILESRVKYLFGIEKLNGLIELSEYYTINNGRKATRYAKQAFILAEEMFLDAYGKTKTDSSNYLPKTYLQLGKAYFHYNKFIDAKDAFDHADKASINNNYEAGISEARLYLDKIDSLAQSGVDINRNFFSQSIKSLELKEKISKATLDFNIATKVNSAETHFKKYEYDEAIQDYQDAVNLLKNKGDENYIWSINERIEEITRLKNIDKTIKKNYEDAVAEQEQIVKELGPRTIDTDSSIQIPEINTIISSQKEIEIVKLELKSDSLIALAGEFLEKKDYDQAELYRSLSLQVEDEIKKREDTETQLTLLRQQKQLADLDLHTKNIELVGQRRAKQNIIFGTLLLIALALALLTLYITKRRDHKKLGRAYYTLEETKSKLTDAERNIRKLLRQQVSEDIAKELMAEGTFLTTKKSFVCIMFLDIRGFTSWAENHAPEEIIEYQNKVFGFMIDIINEFNGNVNQLLGDGFMATFGAPKSFGNDCQNAFDAATKIISTLRRKINDNEIMKTKVGIGLHAGYVVTGNVGTEYRKQYSITGNTVILASRIEQLNKEFGSQLIISKEVFDKLEQYDGESAFTDVIVKGRSKPIQILTVQ